MATKNGAAGEKKHRRLVKYRECLRNHGLLAQLYTLDGCGEFSPSREDPKLCAACNCSRNYHRREEVVKRPRVVPLPTAAAALPLPPPPPPPLPSSHRSPPRLQPVYPPPAPLRKTIPRYRPKTPNPPPTEAASKAVDGGEEETKKKKEPETKVTEEEEKTKKKKKKKKKPKTKFTEAQRARMREFAEKLGWRIIKHNEEAIEKFCEEIGITPQVYKFWINNNRRRIELGESSSAPKA